MSDPSKLDLSDWLSVAVIAISAGVGSAMAWFKSSNVKRDERIDGLEDKVERYKDLVVDQASSLKVLQACQATIQDRLSEIKEDIVNSAERGAHSVNAQMAYMLSEVQKIVTHSKRGHE